jgi:threonine synthase
VLSAISDARPESGFGAMDMLHELTKVPVPAPLAALRDKAPRFNDCVDKADMLEYVRKALH